MLPASISGTSSTLAWPATGPPIRLCLAAAGERALSKAKGPSTMHAGAYWLRSAILARQVASTVAGICGLSNSTAAKHATHGEEIPMTSQK